MVCTGTGTYWAYQRFWNTPERALAALVEAAANADMPEAHRYVSSALWPEGTVLPEPAMLRALAHFGGPQSIAWTTRTDDGASSVWAEETAVPELSTAAGVWLEKVDGTWLLVRYGAGLGEDVGEAAELLRDMRAAADARDGQAFLSRVVAGEGTCNGRDCRATAVAVGRGEPNDMEDVIRMQEVVPGTLRVTEDGEDLVIRWLRKTRYLDQEGMLELRFRKEGGRWMVTSTDGSNFRALDKEVETWTENHGEMLWRAQVAAYAEVKSLNTYCDEWYYSLCLTYVLPTQVKNVGEQEITAIKVSKVRAQRYMGNASQTLWGIWRNLPPGAESSDPSAASAPVRARYGVRDLNETWEFYRVEWIELKDGTRLSYGARDYREAAGGTLTFTDVRAARERGGMSTEAVDNLLEQRAAAGYPVSAGGAAQANGGGTPEPAQ